MGTHPIFESDFDCLTDMGRSQSPRRRRSRDSRSPRRRRSRDSRSPRRRRSRDRGSCSPPSRDRRRSNSRGRSPPRRRRDPRDIGDRPRFEDGRGNYNRGPGRRPPQQKREQPPRPPNRSLFVRPIGPDITVEILGNHFQKYGEIRDIHIPVDFHTQLPRGFAYIEFEDIIESEAAQKAEQNLVLLGQKLSVQFAFGDRKTPGQMKGQKEAVVILQEIKKIQMKYRRTQKDKRRRSRERRAQAGLPPTTSDEDTSDEEIPPPEAVNPNRRKRGLFEKEQRVRYRQQ